MEQREQSQACLYFAESRQRKAKGQYARATVAMPENEDKKPLRQALDLGRFACKELAYVIEPNDINDEFTIKFWPMAKTIDTTNLCSHLQRKLFDEDGIYHPIWTAMQDDPELTAVVRSRQLHIYRNGKKILVLAGKSAPKIIREDPLCELAVC